MEDSSWVFDSLVEFLHGPVWNVPVQTFLEEKSLVFEPTHIIENQSDEKYKEIFEEYKNLIDLMLGSYMDDIGISPKQFEAACEISKKSDASNLFFEKLPFEQIWAANDYDMFVRLMRQKNIELQIQALELIEKRYGSMTRDLNEVYTTTDQASRSNNWDNEGYVMEEIKKLSLSENTDNDDSVVMKPDPEEIYNQKVALQENFDKIEKFFSPEEAKFLRENEKPPQPPNNPTKNNPLGDSNIKKDMNILSAAALPKDSIHSEDVVIHKAVPQADIEQRQLYLKVQRDKLLALKKEVRGRQLDSGILPSLQSRPKSARNARLVLAGQRLDQGDVGKTLQLRKALAERLKSEVMHGLPKSNN